MGTVKFSEKEIRFLDYRRVGRQSLPQVLTQSLNSFGVTFSRYSHTRCTRASVARGEPEHFGGCETCELCA
jgi:hypothetical protein